jgi:hypothetical protein
MFDDMIYVRMEGEKILLIKKIARARGETLSDFVRRALRRELARLGYLSDEEKKALSD